MGFLSLDPSALQRAERNLCILFGAKIHNAEGGFVDDDAIMKPRLKVSLCSRSEGLENITESAVINGLVRKEVVTGSGVREIIDRQARGMKEGILVHRSDEAMGS